MVKEDRRIKTNEVKLIKGLIGKKLVKAEGAIASPPNVAWNTIRLHTNNNYSLDINCYLEKVKINEENDTDEFGVISVKSAKGNKLVVNSILSETEDFVVNKTIEKIEVLESKTVAFLQCIPFCEKLFTKALVFYFNDGCMVIDKLAWFDEMLRISFGESPKNLLYDESQDWESEEDGNEVSFKYSLKEVEL